MSSLLPYLARYAAAGAAGLLAGQDQRRQRLIQQTLLNRQLDRQDRLDTAAEQDRQQRTAATARAQSIQDLQLANPGAPILHGDAPVEVPDAWQAAHGATATPDPDVIASGGYYTRPSQGAQGRQQAASRALFDVLQQKRPDLTFEDYEAMDAPTKTAVLRGAFQPAPAYRPTTEAEAVDFAGDRADAEARARAAHRPPPRARAAPDPAKARDAYVLRRLPELTRPRKDPQNPYRVVPGLSQDDALRTAGDEFDAVHRGPAGTPPPNRNATGDVDLGGDPSALYQRAADAYHQAVGVGVPEAEARVRYDRIVAAIAARTGGR